MLIEQHQALRLAKLMKLQVAGETYVGVVTLRCVSVTPELGTVSLETSWHVDGPTAAPRGILLQSVRPTGALVPELYASWAGFTQAYGLKLPWRD